MASQRKRRRQRNRRRHEQKALGRDWEHTRIAPGVDAQVMTYAPAAAPRRRRSILPPLLLSLFGLIVVAAALGGMGWVSVKALHVMGVPPALR